MEGFLAPAADPRRPPAHGLGMPPYMTGGTGASYSAVRQGHVRPPALTHPRSNPAQVLVGTLSAVVSHGVLKQMTGGERDQKGEECASV